MAHAPQMSIVEIAKALKDSELVEQAGQERLKIALGMAAHEKAGTRPALEPMAHIRLDKGEVVPGFLSRIESLASQIGGKASCGWSESWWNLSIWAYRYESIFDLPVVFRREAFLQNLGRVRFNADEIQALQDFEIEVN